MSIIEARGLADQIELQTEFKLDFQVITGFRVTETTPQNSAKDVGMNSPIEIVFSHKLDSNQAASILDIRPKTNGSFVVKENVIIFTPAKSWQESSLYSIEVTSRVISEKGVELQAPYSFQFQTTSQASTPDETPDNIDEDIKETTDPKDANQQDDEQTDSKPEQDFAPLPDQDKTAPPQEDMDESPKDEKQEEETIEITNLKFSDASQQRNLELDLLTELNQQRTALSQPKIIESTKLRLVTQNYAQDIYIHGYQGSNHSDSDGDNTLERLHLVGIESATFSESIYVNLIFDAQEIINIWLKADQRILTSEFTKAGLCVLEKDNGEYLVVMISTP
ncbi:MAG TPA: hypothetical protein ENN77_01765 [Candidatus Wirthbacteria bacterium]|nr:hypothetical protein [Candidatus Wirthbacteria bacterium]